MLLLTFAVASPVWALEFSYPSIFGGGLDKISQLPHDQQLTAYVRFALNLIFAVCIGVAVLALVAAGFMYVAANQRPDWVVRARETAQRALLGLFILICSYLVLYVINPQLLVFNVNLPSIKTIKPVNPLPPTDKNIVKVVTFNPLQSAVIGTANLAAIQRYDTRAYNEVYDNTGKIKPLNYFSPDRLLARLPDLVKNFISFGANPAKAEDSMVCSLNSQPEDGKICVYQAEIPLRDTERILQQVNDTVDKLAELLGKCQCGGAYSHSTWEWEKKINAEESEASMIYTGNCYGGMSEQDLDYNFGSQKITQQNVCHTKCKNCGDTAARTITIATDSGVVPVSVPECDMRPVSIETKQTTGPDGKASTQWSISINRVYKEDLGQEPPKDLMGAFVFKDNFLVWQPVAGPAPQGAVMPSVFMENSISFYKAKLEILQGILLSQKSKFFPEQGELLGDTLTVNSADYLLGNAWGMEGPKNLGEEALFQNDFTPKAAEWTAQGFDVQLETPKQFIADQETAAGDATNPVAGAGWHSFFGFLFRPAYAQDLFLNSLQDRYNGAAYYFVTYGPVMEDKALDHNQFVLTESGRANLPSVLMDLSLEKIQGFFRECLVSSLGQADYQIPEEEIAKIVQGAIDTGAADSLINALKNNVQGLADFIASSTKTQLSGSFESQLKAKCCEQAARICLGANPAVCDNPSSCVQSEIDDCIKNNLPPDYVSRKITAFLGSDIVSWLNVDDEMQAQMKTFLGEKTQAALASPMGKLYDEIFKGALTTSTERLVPGLTKALDIKLADVKFLGVVIDSLQDMDKFLHKKFGDMKTKVSGYTEQFINGLISDYIGKPINEKIESFKENNPDLFVENLAIDDCYQKLRQGYVFVLDTKYDYGCQGGGDILPLYNEHGEPNKFGICKKQTPEELNGFIDAVKRGRAKTIPVSLRDDGRLFCKDLGEEGAIAQMCQGMGYCWSESQTKCQECQWIGQGGVVQGLTGDSEERSETLKEIKRSAVGGAIGFAQQLGAGFSAMIVHAAVKYAGFIVQDMIIAPLMPYVSQVIDFHNYVDKFLSSTVRDVLPNDVKQVLSSSLEDLVGQVCKEYREQTKNKTAKQPDEPGFTVLKFDSVKVKDESGNLKPFEIGFTPEFSQKFGDKVCQLNADLHTTLLNEIAASSGTGKDIADFLNSKVQDHLSCKARCWLSMSPAEIVFASTPLKNVAQLLNATPQDLICGNIYPDTSGGWDNPFDTCSKCGTDSSGKCNSFCQNPNAAANKTAANQPAPAQPQANSPGAKCDSFGLAMSPLPDAQTAGKLFGSNNSVFGFLPLVDSENQNYKNLSKADQNFYSFYCAFRNVACKTPSEVFNKAGLAGVLAQLVQTGCALADKHIKTLPDNSPNAACGPNVCLAKLTNEQFRLTQANNNVNCPEWLKYGVCWTCSVLTQNTMAGTLFHYAINNDFGAISRRAQDPELKGKETEVYQWLLVYFPKLGEDIKIIALSRGFSADDWAGLSSEVAAARSFNFKKLKLSELGAEGFLRMLVSWRLSGAQFKGETATVKNILTSLPLDIIASQTSFYAKQQTGQSANFLTQTPDKIVQDVCNGIDSSFENDFPNLALARVESDLQAQASQQAGAAAEFSAEKLDNTILFDAIRFVYNGAAPDGSSVPDERKLPYLFCKSLEFSPAQLLGLDEPLISFIRPKELQILFQIMQDPEQGLRPDEMPEFLNNFLNYINDSNPLEAIRDLSSNIEHKAPETGDMKKLFNVVLTSEEKIGLNTAGKFSDLPEHLKNAFPARSGSVIIGDNTPVNYGNVDPNNFEIGVIGERYYLAGIKVQGEMTTDWIIKVYYSEAGQAESARLNQLASFLTTPLGEQISFGGRKLIDVICEEPVEIDLNANNIIDANERFEGGENGWCSWSFNESLESAAAQKLAAVEKILGQTPLEWLVKNAPQKLQKNLFGGADLTSQLTLMDQMALKKPVLKQKLADILGSVLNAQTTIFGMSDFTGTASNAVDNGLAKTKEFTQNLTDEIFVNKPTEAVESFMDVLSRWWAEKTGQKTSDEITGVCRDNTASAPISKKDDCREGEVFRTTKNDQGKEIYQCCSLGRSAVCENRCRTPQAGEQCDYLGGEKEENNKCCFAKSDDKKSCLQNCRLERANDEGKCHADQGEEELPSQTNSSLKDNLCCRKNALTIVKEKKEGGAEGETVDVEKCCKTAVQCVADKYAVHLNSLAEMIANGKLLLRSFSGK
ncbi:MAG: hypothetical protein M1127_01000 [Patescibacteria group bacterium]|nr:hypothetical protein [Patescibacteria group bacterium]